MSWRRAIPPPAFPLCGRPVPGSSFFPVGILALPLGEWGHDIALPFQEPFIDGEPFQPHGAAGVNLRGLPMDSHLRPQPEAESIGKPRRGVPEDIGGIHPPLEKVRVGGGFRDDGVGMV